MTHPQNDPSVPDPDESSDPSATPPADLHAAWRSVLEDLQAFQRAWLRTSQPVTVHENTAIISVPNEFTRGQLEGRLRGQIEEALGAAYGRAIRIAVTVDPALEPAAVAEPEPPIVAEPTRRLDDMSTHAYDQPRLGAAEAPPPSAPAVTPSSRPG